MIEKASVTAILIGKIDLKKVVEAKIRGLRIVDFEVLAPTSKEACIKLNIEVPVELIDDSMQELKRISKEENAILITSV